MPETCGAVVASCLPDGSCNDMLTVNSNTFIYSAGKLCAISQLQLRLTLAPIGLIGLGGSLVKVNSIKGGTEF